VNMEALLIASGQNVKRLLTFEGRRPKKTAQVAALRPPVPTGYEISRTREHRSSRSWLRMRAFSTRWQAKRRRCTSWFSDRFDLFPGDDVDCLGRSVRSPRVFVWRCPRRWRPHTRSSSLGGDAG
jgi:hypothetical protein